VDRGRGHIGASSLMVIMILMKRSNNAISMEISNEQ
jgi:hypothetical protein